MSVKDVFKRVLKQRVYELTHNGDVIFIATLVADENSRVVVHGRRLSPGESKFLIIKVDNSTIS